MKKIFRYLLVAIVSGMLILAVSCIHSTMTDDVYFASDVIMENGTPYYDENRNIIYYYHSGYYWYPVVRYGRYHFYRRPAPVRTNVYRRYYTPIKPHSRGYRPPSRGTRHH